MFRKSILATTLILLVGSTDVFALGLGALRTRSALNQPFFGEIDLLDVQSDEIDALKVGLATPEAFDKAGADRPHFLTRLRFTPVVAPDGRPVIQIASREPMREPYLDFLLEVVWPGGRLVKEYAVLLDPPVTTSRRAPRIAQPAVAPRPAPPAPSPVKRASPPPVAPESTVAEPAPRSRLPSAPPPEPATAPVATSPGSVPGAGVDVQFPLRYGPVPSGAGLWRIARSLAPPGATVAQTAMALYRNSQDAFVRGNINKLRVGTELVVPSREALFALDPDEAERQLGDAVAGRSVTSKPIVDAAAGAAEAKLTIAGAPAGPSSEPAPGATGTVPVPGAGTSASPQDVGGGEAEVGAGGEAGTETGIEADLLLMREASEANRQEAAELRERILDLETQLGDIRRLLELRTEQLAQLQPGPALSESAPDEAPSADDTGPSERAGDGEAATEAMGEAAPAPAGSVAAQASGAVADLSVEQVDEVQVEGPSPRQSEAGVEPSAGPPAESTVPEGEADTASPGLLASLSRILPAWLLAVVGGVVLIGGLGLLAVRRRRAVASPSSDSLILDLSEEVEPEPPSPASAPAPETGTESGEPRARQSGPGGGGATEGGTEAEAPAASAQGIAEARSLQSETQDSDVIAEADIFILYGRYREAESLLLEELENAPARADVKYKLAEAYMADGNRQALAALVARMRQAGDAQYDSSRWETILEALTEPPAPTDATAPGKTAAPDPETGVGVDIDKGMESSAASEPVAEGVEPDAAARRMDRTAPGPGPVPSSAPPEPGDSWFLGAEDTELDLHDLDALGPIDSGTSTASRSPASPPPSLDSDDDLDIDLDGLNDLDAAGNADSELDLSVQVVNVDDLETDLASGLGAEPESPSSAPRAEPAPAPVAAPHLPGAPPVVPDLSAIEVAESADEDGAPQWGVDTGLWDEVSTKLDLARAYVEMDDAEAARAILEEVIEEGNEEQQGLARELLKTMA